MSTETAGAAPAVAAETPVVPPVTPAPATPSPTPAVPSVITMTPEEYRAILEDRTRLANIDAEMARQKVEAQAKEFAALAKAGDIEKAMNLLKQQNEENAAIRERQSQEKIDAERRAAQQFKESADADRARLENERRSTQARAEKFALSGELGRALAGHNLVDGAADDLTVLLAPSLTVQPHGESFTVQSSTGQPVAEFVRAYLAARPHYVKAGGLGGTSTGQTPQAGPTPAANPATPEQPKPKNAGEALLLNIQQQLANRPNGGDPILNRELAFGLGPVAK